MTIEHRLEDPVEGVVENAFVVGVGTTWNGSDFVPQLRVKLMDNETEFIAERTSFRLNRGETVRIYASEVKNRKYQKINGIETKDPSGEFGIAYLSNRSFLK